MHKYYKYIVYTIILFLNTIVFSQSLQDLQKMKIEYEKMMKDQVKDQPPITGSQEIIPTLPYPESVQIIPFSVDNIDQEIETNHFGYNYFTKRDTINFWENLPTPSNYLLGPGDELVVTLWGETQLRQVYIISREGTLYDEKVGLLNIAGQTIKGVHDYLKNQFGRVYATLNGNNPSTFIDVSLGKLKSINVNFVGELNLPGLYPIHPFSSLITGLIQIGGVDTTGSLRNIQIVRNGEKKTIDLYDFLIKGKVSSSVQLRDQDIVIVPPRFSIIKVDSAVFRPGYYESIQGEKVYDIIQFAGGPTFEASDNIGIRRLKPINERDGTAIYEGLYINLSESKSIPVNSGDEITISKIFDEINEVEIIGQVKNPGKYHYFSEMTFRDLLDLGGGLNDPTFLKSVYLSKAEIIRRNPGGRYDQVLPVNLQQIINNQDTNKIFLQNLDRVVIHANLNFFEKENILILGEVNIPGFYPLVSDNESLKSFISRAGGLTSKALENGISIYRSKEYFESGFTQNDSYKTNPLNTSSPTRLTNANLSNINNSIKETNVDEDEENKISNKIRVAWENMNIALMPGDSVVVKEKTATVFITGAVYNPGVVEFSSGKSLRSYLNSAGGLTDLANKQGIIVLYANGNVRPKRWYSSPAVLEGSTIIVNEKPPEDPFNITQFATNWTQIISSMITAIVLSKQL